MKESLFYTVSIGLFTFLVVWFVEKLTFRVSQKLFKRHLKVIEEKEKKIQEYQYLSLLAIVSKEKEAVYGFQDMASELYWQIFFQKLIMFSSLFFLLLSPYMLLIHYLFRDLIPFSFGLIFALAIFYFMIKTIYTYVVNLIRTRKDIKSYRRRA